MTELADDRRQFKITAGTKACDFIMSNRTVDLILGPLGSGKTHALCARIMRHAQEQRPSTRDGLRKTRWAIVRNSYPDLKRSTIRTWTEIVPEHVYGKMNWSLPPTHKLRFGDVAMEVDFLALDKDEDIRKLRSTEYTGIAFNELPFIPKALWDEASSRLRYPSKDEGGATWRGLIADGNAPDEDHWTAVMTGMVDLPPGAEEEGLGKWPEDWGLHIQPPALIEQFDQNGRITGYETNPHAENLKNLDADYYAKQIAGKSKAWIDSRLMVRVALVVDGSAVWPMFRVEVHVAAAPLKPVVHAQLQVGLDFGRQPFAVFGQNVNNRILIPNELPGFNEGAVTFAPKVARFIAQHFPDHDLSEVRFWGDPKGQDKGQADERTAYDIFAAHGMTVRPPPGLRQNMISTRVDAVAAVLNEMYDARPRFLLSPLARTLKVAMAGRYHNERDEQGELKPCKDRYSNPADALQYLVLGMGEGRRMIGRRPISDMAPVRVVKRGSMRRIAV
jgi:hypothetical protein